MNRLLSWIRDSLLRGRSFPRRGHTPLCGPLVALQQRGLWFRYTAHQRCCNLLLKVATGFPVLRLGHNHLQNWQERPTENEQLNPVSEFAIRIASLDSVSKSNISVRYSDSVSRFGIWIDYPGAWNTVFDELGIGFHPSNTYLTTVRQRLLILDVLTGCDGSVVQSVQ